MDSVLAIDAAWTATEPSGVALIQKREYRWRCITVAPSYDQFFAHSEGQRTDWSFSRFCGSTPDIPRLLAAAQSFVKERIRLIAVDMPVATKPFSSRRMADNAVSREFGPRNCATHSPSSERPGALGKKLTEDFNTAGYPLATTAEVPGKSPAMIEVYPHPALLSLLKVPQRFKYKVSKARRFWPNCDRRDRIAALLGQFTVIYTSLTEVFGPLGFDLPNSDEVHTLTQLKRYEDALDALVCAWVGVEYFNGRAVPLGDDTAAIWCPSDVVIGRS